MKTYLSILVILFMMFSCQEKKNGDADLNAKIIKEKIAQKTDKEARKDQKPKNILTKAKYEEFFPKQLDTYNLINIAESESMGIGTATYIKGKDYAISLTYYVTDGYTKGSAAIRNFEGSYQSNQDWPEGTELISKEREGFKTVALLRHKYNKYKVSILYNKRFVLTVEGHEKPDELWEYLKQADLKLLDSY